MKDIEIKINYNSFSYTELPDDYLLLINEAKDATKRSYCPYSHYHVGVALKLSDNIIIQGNNQENCTYHDTICGERNALFYAHGKYPNNSIEMIAIIASNDENEYVKDICTPCGTCRQVLLEFEEINPNKKPIKIICCSNTEVIVFNSIHDLLPLAFGPNNLK